MIYIYKYKYICYSSNKEKTSKLIPINKHTNCKLMHRSLAFLFY